MSLLVGVGMLAAAAPASADVGPEPVGIVVRSDDGTQSRSFRVTGLYPTATRQVVFLIEGDTPDEPRRMRLTVENLVDRENGCLDPEIREGDVACERGDGDLSAWLGTTLTAGRTDGPGCTPVGVPVRTTLRAMATEPVVVGLPDRDGRLCVIADLRHDEGAGDDVTQSDSAGFDLRLDLDAQPVAAAAAGSPDTATAAAVRPAAVERGDVVDLGPAAPGVAWGVPMLLGGLVLGGCAAALLGLRRRSGLTP